MKYYIIAGEASGDLHGSNLIKEINNLDAEADIRCWGGDLMKDAGGIVVKHYRDLAFMGFLEVIKNLPTILRNLKFCKEDIQQFHPDVLVLIDYPGFNLRIAKWAKTKTFRIVYYISPQVWAWKESRVKLIKETVDKMLVILPFEKDFYSKWDYKVEYVGHPLVQVIEQHFIKNQTKDLVTVNATGKENTFIASKESTVDQKPVIALLPGSREQEIKVKLPIMLEASKKFPAFNFIIAQAPGQPLEFYLPFIQAFSNVDIALAGQTYDLLKISKAALVTSGTATLETALFSVPQIVCYKGSKISYQIAKWLVKIKYISLVNLIMDKPVVKELIQEELTSENLVLELSSMLFDEIRKEQIMQDYKQLKILLQQEENASVKAAQEIISVIKN